MLIHLPNHLIPNTHPDDLILWADGTCCYRSELEEMFHMSDDYETIHYNTYRWHCFVRDNDL